MINYSVLSICLILFGLCIACDNEDCETKPMADCDQTVILDAQLYDTATTDGLLSLMSLGISEDCLNLSYSGSGCDGSSFELRLVDSEGVAESLPPQRDLRILFQDHEECEAVILQDASIDITPLQVGGSSIVLNISYPLGGETVDTSLVYSY